MRAAAGLLRVRVDVGIFQPEPWTVPSVQAHGRAGTLVLSHDLLNKTKPNGPF
jgi:hypothetical protein